MHPICAEAQQDQYTQRLDGIISQLGLIQADTSFALDVLDLIEGSVSGISALDSDLSEAVRLLTVMNTRQNTQLAYLNHLSTIDNRLANIYAALSGLPDYSSRLSSILTALDVLGTIDYHLQNFRSEAHTDSGAINSSLSSILTATRNDTSVISNQLERVIGKLSISSSTPAGSDPWWSTNSEFALIGQNYSLVRPTDTDSNIGTMSFPQFMSSWGRLLTRPWNRFNGNLSQATLARDWYHYWGATDPWASSTYLSSFTPQNPYSWYDWMSDAMRSNWTINASADLRGLAISNTIAYSVAEQDTIDSEAVDDAEEDVRYTTEPSEPTYTPAAEGTVVEADKDNLLDALDSDVEHSTELVLLSSSDFCSATGVQGEMVLGLTYGRFGTFVSQLSTICNAGWYALLAVLSATLFWRKQNEISGIIKGTGFSRV